MIKKPHFLMRANSQAMRAVWKHQQRASESSRRQMSPRLVHDAILWQVPLAISRNGETGGH